MTKMLIASTVTVLTAVLVNKDLLEMVQFVKVCFKAVKNNPLRLQHNQLNPIVLGFTLH